ncbi:MAG: MiaB/RimO family radical SAM methylthiotransferase, partial [Thermoleophilia bacterium]|nr:MiaB/RimO family radical SAM methylthiotransferase [Thermoleophilia bacterium]
MALPLDMQNARPTTQNAWPNTHNPRPKVAFRTIGCKLNQCETAQMQELLVRAGYELVGWEEPANIRVINTCTVTAKSDRTCRREIRAARRLDPHCLVAVTGCYAQVDPQAVASIPGVDLVLGNIDKFKLAEVLRDLERSKSAGGITAAAEGPLVAVSPYPEQPAFEADFITHFYGYTRAFLKIQTGCNSRCSYCIVPSARGPARSMPAGEVIAQVKLLEERGFAEVVLTGINLGSWGREWREDGGAALATGRAGPATSETAPATRRAAPPPQATDGGSAANTTTLAGLLKQLLEQTAVPRFRLSSIEPLEVDSSLLDVMEAAEERVAHHFHLPLQSGSDAVLRRMNRPYRAAEYLRVVEEIVARFPNAAVGADVIVGFPGESEQEFAQTLTFVERCPLTYLHVFSYSDRPGTPAYDMGPKVAPEVIHERSQRLRQLGERKKAEFRQRIAGSVQTALILREPSPEGMLQGVTGN